MSHYLIDFINFVSYNQDVKNIHAVVAVAIDFSKAFNRQNHCILIELLSELGVPGWLLQIVIGFLENREIEVHYKGIKSSKKPLPGGGPQGTVLGMFLFLILINAAGFKNIARNTGEVIRNPSLSRRQPMEKIHLKYIDDMTVAESVNLKESLVEICNPQHPLKYHERTGHSLPPSKSKLQNVLTELVTYSDEHQMKINGSKTKAILFNKSRNYDFLPHLTLGNSSPIDVLEEIKLLGVVVSSDLSWAANTKTMCCRAYSRLWILRRLKLFGVSPAELLDIYEKQIRCILEYASPVWSGGLTKSQTIQIERVQKAAFAIILGGQYLTYEKALGILDRPSLECRRKQINTTFAKKSLASTKFCHWFSSCDSNTSNMQTRSKKKSSVMPVPARTKGFEKSPIPYLTRLLIEQ